MPNIITGTRIRTVNFFCLNCMVFQAKRGDALTDGVHLFRKALFIAFSLSSADAYAGTEYLWSRTWYVFCLSFLCLVFYINTLVFSPFHSRIAYLILLLSYYK